MIHSELPLHAGRQLVERSADFGPEFLCVRAALKHDNAVVEMYRRCGLCKFRRRHSAAAVVRVQFINKVFAGFDEACRLAEAAFIFFPIRCMQVLDEIHAIFQHLGVEKIKARDEVTHNMATVIHNDIRNADLVDHTLKKSWVLLSADMYFDLIFTELFAFGIDVDTDDSRVWAKIPLPHLQRST